MKFAGVELTAESIRAAHLLFAENARACIAEMERGEVTVNDPEGYRAWRESHAAEHEAHANGTATEEYRYSVAFMQCAHTIQTGECVALLP